MAATIDKDLVTALKAAKGGKAMQFAFVAKGGGGKLLAGKTVSPKDAADLKKEVGGALLRGRLLGEEGTLVFETANEAPSSLSGQLQKVIKESAGLTMPLLVRSNGAAEGEEAESEAAVPPLAPPPPADKVAAPLAPPPPADKAAAPAQAVVKRMNALTGAVKAALAAQGPEVGQIKTLLAQAAQSIKSGDADQAAKALDELEPLLAQAAPPPPADKADAQTPNGDELTKQNEALKTIQELAAKAEQSSAKFESAAAELEKSLEAEEDDD